MLVDLDPLSPGRRYKLLASLIVPRPIAFVTTVSAAGIVNAAPYSFFNCFGSDPALVICHSGDRPPPADTPKDTYLNIKAQNGAFVVNLVSETMARRMNACAAPLPHGVSEAEVNNLPTEPIDGFPIPRLAESPASLACRLLEVKHVGNNRLLLGQVHHIAAADGLIDPDTFRVDADRLHLIGRMGPPGGYTTTRDTFDL